MKGLKILSGALALMGISHLSDEVRKTGLYVINVICEDLEIPPLDNIENKLSPLSEKELVALTYGVATKLCASMGDEYLKDVFQQAYTEKRKQLKASVPRIKNSIFTGEMKNE